jgi:nicotinate phosphoribosyltransferase
MLHHPSGDIRHLRIKAEGLVKAMLKPCIEAGKATLPVEDLSAIRARAMEELDSFDDSFKRLLNPHVYKVSITEGLKELKLSLISKYEV